MTDTSATKLTPTEFASVVTAITSAFGDPTRRDIYLYVHECPDGVTAAETAAHFDLHANVARHHLDKLAGGGYLDVARAARAGAGRPSKVYSCAQPEIRVEFPVRHHDVLVTLLGKALAMLSPEQAEQMADVFWDDPEFVLIDLPPGTGDISLSLAQFLPRAEVYVVTTPQPAAQRVAQRAAFMADTVNLEVKGVIENMSWFTGDDGKRYHLFGAGGGKELADRLEVPLLGMVPLTPELREGADGGNPLVATAPQSEAGAVFAEMARSIDEDLRPTRRYHPELNLLEGS